LNVRGEAEIYGQLHRVAAAERAHRHDPCSEHVEHGARIRDVVRCATDERHEPALEDTRNRAEHRRVDDPRAACRNLRRKLANRRRL